MPLSPPWMPRKARCRPAATCRGRETAAPRTGTCSPSRTEPALPRACLPELLAADRLRIDPVDPGDVFAGATDDEVVPFTVVRVEHVAAGTAGERVAAVSADDPVVAAAAAEHVWLTVAVEDVVSAFAEEGLTRFDVVARLAFEGADDDRPAAAAEPVGAGAAVDLEVADVVGIEGVAEVAQEDDRVLAGSGGAVGDAGRGAGVDAGGRVRRRLGA